MPIVVDVTEVLSLAARAEEHLSQVGRQMGDILEGAIDIERNEHDYENQTGDLEANTFSFPVTYEENLAVFEFGSRMPYASYVEDRGLSHVADLAKEADEEVQFRFENMVKEITG